MALSPAVDLAWKIAISEAVATSHPTILAEDVMIGICKLPGFDQSQVPSSTRDVVAAEVDKLTRLFTDFPLAPVAYYRKLRQRVAGESGPEPSASMNRSPAARAAFEAAADSAGEGRTTSLHLLAALLSDLDSASVRLMAEMRVASEPLRRAALAAVGAVAAPVKPRPEPVAVEARPAPPVARPEPEPEPDLPPLPGIEMLGKIAAAVDAGAQPFASPSRR